MKRIPLLLPLVSGCLLNFNAFDEQDFLADYESLICELYLDCLDGTHDGVIGQNEESAGRAVCQSWVQTAYNQGCQVRADFAGSCFDELEDFKSTLESSGDCDLLASELPLASCSVTYLDCPNDAPFGTLPDSSNFDAPRIDSLSPRVGPTAGNTRVAITGAGFDDKTQVLFGNLEAVIETVDSNHILVLTPAATASHSIVNVTNAYGNTIAEDRFEFWEDISSMTGILGYYKYTTPIGDYWTAQDVVDGRLLFSTGSSPREYEYSHVWGVEPASNNCEVVDYTRYSIDSLLSMPYQSISLSESGGHDATLELNSYGVYELTSSNSTITRNAAYNLTAPATEGWPEIAFENVFRGPPDIQMIQPDFINARSIPILYKNDFVVRWKYTGANNYIVFRLMKSLNDVGGVMCSFESARGEASPAPMISPSILQAEYPGIQDLFLEICSISTNFTHQSPINNGLVSVSGLNCVVGKLRLVDPGGAG